MVSPEPFAGPPRLFERRRDLAAILAMTGLFFLVVCAIGILRPIRNALALDGLGQTDFYKVYLVSAVVVLFVPVLNRLSDRVSWPRLVPAVALFFALNLLLFRALYSEGSTAFGLVFYGWYDLFAAALVTQVFVVTQLFVHSRMARHAYPLVISGGALGATAGGAITGFFAERLGTPNLLLVAAALVGLFTLAVPGVLALEGVRPEGTRTDFRAPRGDGRARRSALGRSAGGSPAATLRAIAGNRQVRLVATMVLMTVLVKQLVDYQFNTLTKEIFLERDAISAFQGKFNAATQWLPLVVLAAMRRPLARWGVGFVVLLLPVAMLLSNVGLVVFWGLWAAVAAKGAETSVRYSAERTGREILYLPVPPELKLKAKAYIDVAVEKGVGKVASALLIFLLLSVMEYRQVAWVAVGLSLLWIAMALSVRREYVRALAGSMERRFASARGVFAPVVDASTAAVLREALEGDAPRAAFALDLLDEAAPANAAAFVPELERLLADLRPEIRRRAFELLSRLPGVGAPGLPRRMLADPHPALREAAVRVLAAGHPAVLQELVASSERDVRIAALTCIARGDVAWPGRTPSELPPDGLPGLPTERAESPLHAGARIERALAVAAFRPPDAAKILRSLIEDPDPDVGAAAAHGAGLFGDPDLDGSLADALARPWLRAPAREALVRGGERVVPLLATRLLDPRVPLAVRRQIPPVLGHIPSAAGAEALIACILAPETDRLLDHRAIKALSRLRTRHPGLVLPADRVDALLAHSLEAWLHYARALATLEPLRDGRPGMVLLAKALAEARDEKREELFRCLGLRLDPDSAYRCWLALTRGDRAARADALEWLENVLGPDLLGRLEPVLDGAGTRGTRPSVRGILAHLQDDHDRWVARCAERALSELGVSDREPDALPGAMPEEDRQDVDVDLIEKVFLLQRVDVLEEVSTAHLALLATIAEEVEAEPGTILVRRDVPNDALHVVVRGAIEVRGDNGRHELAEGEAFGIWALIGEAPSVWEAVAPVPTRLLRIGRQDLLDLLADHPELAAGMLRGVARRVRGILP